MRCAILLLLLVAGCSFAQLTAVSPPATVSPTLPPTRTPVFDAPNPRVELSASAMTLRVGEVVTITGRQINIGMPGYTLRLSSGIEIIVNHMDENLGGTEQDANFEVVSAHGNLDEVVFTLRALAPGEVDVVISATGEVATSDGGYMWSGGGSEPLHLTILS